MKEVRSSLAAHRPCAHLMRGNLGSRARTRVLGRWKTTLYRGLRSFLNWLFLTALAALAALLLSAATAGRAAAGVRRLSGGRPADRRAGLQRPWGGDWRDGGTGWAQDSRCQPRHPRLPAGAARPLAAPIAVSWGCRGQWRVPEAARSPASCSTGIPGPPAAQDSPAGAILTARRHAGGKEGAAGRGAQFAELSTGPHGC